MPSDDPYDLTPSFYRLPEEEPVTRRGLFVPQDRPRKPQPASSTFTPAHNNTSPGSAIPTELDERVAIASDPATRPQLLHVLARDTASEVRRAAYNNPNTLFESFDHACRTSRDLTYQEGVRLWLQPDCFSEGITPRVRLVATHMNWQWRKALCEVTSDGRILEFVAERDNDPRVLTSIVRNVNASVPTAKKSTKKLEKNPYAQQVQQTTPVADSQKGRGVRGAVRWFLMN